MFYHTFFCYNNEYKLTIFTIMKEVYKMEKIIIKNNESYICAKCNGKCCRHHSCETHPDDVFGTESPSIERLLEFLSCGKYQIDWWDGDIREKFNIPYEENDYRDESYHIRPAHTNSLHTLFDPAYYGTCIFFVDGKGCMLDFEYRPYGGKALVPSHDMKCHSSYSKAESSRDWSKYHDMFETIRYEYGWTYNEDGTISFTKNNN